MNRIRLKNNIRIWFDKGKFDDWCVYVKENGKIKYYKDEDYFNVIKNLSECYGKELVYNDFKYLYDDVEKIFNKERMLKVCKEVSRHYNEDVLKWFIVIYMTMVAEENKENSILGKRIKNLGIYNILFDGYEIDYVTSYMNGMKWYELDKLMKERGI